MKDQKRIALFVDVENLQLTAEHIDNLLYRLEKEGAIVYGKLYGAVDRKYKDIAAIAAGRGFGIESSMRNKKRGGKVFDSRIFVDVMEAIYTQPSIDAVAIISQPADLVHLFSKLKKEDVEVIAVDYLDEDSLRLVDEIIHFGYVAPIKAEKQKTPAAPKKAVAPVMQVQPTPIPVVSETIYVQPAPVEAPAPVAIPVPKKEESDMEVFRQIQDLKASSLIDNTEEDSELLDKIKKLLEEFS